MSSQLTRREFALRTAGAGLILGLAPAALLAEGQHPPGALLPPPADLYSVVDPDLVPALKAFATHDFSQDILAQARRTPPLPPLPAPAPQPVERHIPGPAGAPSVRVWVIDPAPAEKNKPLFLHTHGGGYITPNPAMMPWLQGIATDCHCVVVSVDYRLAPETHYPGSLEDNYAALKWAHANAAELGIDRARIAIGGESAGGGHAATLAIHARDRNEVPIAFQLLIYPMLDDRTGSTRAAPPAVGHFVWTAASNRFGWSSLLGVPAGSLRVPEGAVPARAASVNGLPPAWIGVGSIDLFVEEDMDYARRLVDAGISTELFVVPGAYHGFNLLVPNAPASRQFTASWKAALRKAFST